MKAGLGHQKKSWVRHGYEPTGIRRIRRAHTPDPQAQEPLSPWTEVWPTQPVLTLDVLTPAVNRRSLGEERAPGWHMCQTIAPPASSPDCIPVVPIGPLLAAASDAAARMRERRGDVTPTSRNLTCPSYPAREWPMCPIILRAITPLRLSRAAVRMRSRISCAPRWAPSTSMRRAK